MIQNDAAAFTEMVKGLENEPEKGARCYRCYALRLSKTAQIAKEKGFAYFATTLTLSPHKNAEWLNEIGQNEATRYALNYLCSDFSRIST